MNASHLAERSEQLLSQVRQGLRSYLTPAGAPDRTAGVLRYLVGRYVWKPQPEEQPDGSTRWVQRRVKVAAYDLSRATNLPFLEAARDQVRAEVLRMQDVVRGTTAAEADPALDGTWLEAELAPAIAEVNARLNLLRAGWVQSTPSQRIAIEREGRGRRNQLEALQAEVSHAKRAKSAFYRADEVFAPDSGVDWREMFRGATEETVAWDGDADPQWAGDITEWRKDQASAPLTVEEFGSMSRTPVWAETVPVVDADAAPVLAEWAVLADQLTVRIGELRALEAAGGRLSLAQLEKPHPRYPGGGFLLAESMLAPEGAIDSRAHQPFVPTEPLVAVRRPRYRTAADVLAQLGRLRLWFESAYGSCVQPRERPAIHSTTFRCHVPSVPARRLERDERNAVAYPVRSMPVLMGGTVPAPHPGPDPTYRRSSTRADVLRYIDRAMDERPRRYRRGGRDDWRITLGQARRAA